MASPNTNYSEIITTTIENRSGELADNITDNNAILRRLKKKGKVNKVYGGHKIIQELEYADNGTVGWYSGYDTISTALSDVFTAAEFNWKQLAGSVSISGLEIIQNRGSPRIIDLFEARIKNLEKSLANTLAAGMYSDGTGSGGKQIGGLQLLVADSPSTGTVGNINRATYSFWRNFSYDATTDGGAAASSSNIHIYMNHVWLNVSRDTDHPDLILADNNYYKLYWQYLQGIQRINDTEMGEAGFNSLAFMDADVVFDGGLSGNCPTNHMYFLNTDYLFFRPDSETDMVVIGGERLPLNQDAIVKIVAWAGNMTASNCMLQGLLKD